MIKVQRPEAVYFLPHGLPPRKVERFTQNGSEPWLREFIPTLLAERPGSVISAGAYVGGLLPTLSKCSTKVYAWEPIQEHFECVRHMLVTNNINNVILHNAALGNGHQDLDLTTGCEGAEWLGGDSCVILNGALTSPRLEQGQWRWRKQTASQHTIDDFTYGPISVLQLDLEGYELQALQGAFNTIRKHCPIIIIEHNANAARYLNTLGYTKIQEHAGDVVYKYTKGEHYGS